ncbi:MAG TPA: L-type lectin-domain containing protein [Verrucomicrobiales bacterium]|nr:L-type lectin-domain containing protein [Verrucomicrobiales bacterium]
MKTLLSTALLAVVVTSSHAATVLNYPNFSNTAGLQLNGAAAQAGSVLRVTPSAAFQGGSVFSTSAVTLNPNVSFSTFFSFRIDTPGGISDFDGQGADGLVFVVQTNSNSVGGAGGGIGYQGINNSLGIEFDTWFNPELGDADGNHVGINTNGSLASALGEVNVSAGRLNNGSIWYAWVDYDGTTDGLEVRLSTTSTRPAAPIVSSTVDLTTVLGGTNAFVGFTSGTGSAFNNHDLLAWEFRDDFNPVIEPPRTVPDGGGTLGIMGLSLGGLMLGKRFLRRTTATA